MKKFDLLDLGDTLTKDLKIRLKEWHKGRYILPNNVRLGWKDQDMDEAFPDFNPIYNWEFYIEPKKPVERTFYKPLIYAGGTGIFYTGDHWAIDRAHNLLPNEQIVEWYERKFTPPE